MDVETILNSTVCIRLFSMMARRIPAPLGDRMADVAAGQIARQRSSELVRAVRANQGAVLGWNSLGGNFTDGSLGEDDLDWAVRETLRLSARAVFDLYHYKDNLAATKELIFQDPVVRQLAERPEFGSRGLIIAGLHLSNFDLLLRWFCRQDIRPMVLTIPDPRSGRRLEYEMRRDGGMNLVPATVSGLRLALGHLERGGAVLTGIDRPVDRPRIQPCFFGKVAALPTHHIFLATKARVPVVVVGAVLELDRKYHVLISDPIEMDSDRCQEIETLRNAEKVLRIAEQFIRRAPEQWSVPLPVWPSSTGAVPARRGNSRQPSVSTDT